VIESLCPHLPEGGSIIYEWSFPKIACCIDRNSKEAFVKKLQICMKHYDYKDETKDVRGKVSFETSL
jgi:hypothetical protein